MRRIRIAGIAVAVAVTGAAGCSRPDKPATSAPRAAPPGPPGELPEDEGPICAATAARYYAPALARSVETPQHELFALQRDAMIDSCRATLWPATARNCFAKRTIDDNTCMDRLAPLQRDDWRRRSADALRTANEQGEME